MKTLQKFIIPLTLICCLALGLFLFAACSGNDAQSTTNGSSSSESGTLTGTDATTDSGTEETTDDVTDGYTVTVTADANVTVYVYETQDYSLSPEETNVAYARDSETGEIVTNGTGQVNLLLEVATGYIIKSVVINEETTSNLKTPADTGEENVYRITKIASDLTVTVTTMTVTEAENTANGWEILFNTDGHATVYVYKSQDYNVTPVQTNAAYSRNGDYGYITLTDGQVNFKVVCNDGYTVDTIEIDGEYKNLKGYADTGMENVYRITKIADDLTVTVTTKTATDEEQGYTVMFVGDHCTVTVDDVAVTSALSIDKTTGNPTTSGEGQVTFVIVCDEGYAVESVTATGTYKNLKDPTETGSDNTYRVTKVASDVVVTINVTAQ